MHSYFRMTPTQSGLTPDGWCSTGDLGYMVDDDLYVTGRIKELIIIGGRNFHPSDIEDVVSEFAEVRTAMSLHLVFRLMTKRARRLLCALRLMEPTFPCSGSQPSHVRSQPCFWVFSVAVKAGVRATGLVDNSVLRCSKVFLIATARSTPSKSNRRESSQMSKKSLKRLLRVPR